MGVSHFLSSLCCELRILQAKNIEPNSPGNLFIRYYLPAGNNKRIRLNSQKVSSKSELIIWNESFSLECSGAEESVNYLKQQTVVFELRLKSTLPILGKMGKSQLLGRAEMPWKAIFESPNMEIEKYWLTMVSMNDRVLQNLKPPSIQISMKLVRGPAAVEIEKNKKKKEKAKNNWDGCGCKDIGRGCSCADYEIFALAAAMEGL
ncbi:uncharacterized protein LOC111301022 [Durio zibethinus]|uniref:Uncharacterized protein LOC111301022 n=1 Tax=Durio zibethinus TaxID=66656 RepID=A0A6P5ZHR6_DURZI|nr:uncharacterized protein LOC111301022 [Durio zibethinus]